MIDITIFKNQFDNKTHRKMNFADKDQFLGFLSQLSKKPLEGKRNAQLISPAVYIDGSTRANKNVSHWAGWCAVDVDDYVFEGKLKEVLDEKLSWGYICYSTASSTIEQPKFRLVFQIKGNVPAERIRHFWFALNQELEGMGDKQTKDLSRMYFIPAEYKDANNFFFSNPGVSIDPYELMSRHEYNEKKNSNNFLDRLPESLQEQVIAYRQTQLTNTDITWTSYLDCPFWPKHLATEYMMIAGEGWYRKMYAIMVRVAATAIYREYPITADEIATLCKQFDMANGNWYENRPMRTEADRALEYVHRN